MEVAELIIKLKAIKNHVSQVSLMVENLNREPIKNKDGTASVSPRETYFNSYNGELRRIKNRYALLEGKLKEFFPDYFPEIMSYADIAAYDLKGFLRELDYILEILEAIELENKTNSTKDFYPFGNTKSQDNSPFTYAEQEVIQERLETVKSELIKLAKEQSSSDEILDRNIKLIDEKIDELVKSSSTMGRKDWLQFLFGTTQTLCFALMFSNEARTTLFEVLKLLFQLYRATPLLGF